MPALDLQTIVVATRNAGKLSEFRLLLRPLKSRVLGLGDLSIHDELEESGDSFNENARLKALAYSLRTRFPVLADDSGLEVEALGGNPGIHSARYAGAGASDRDRVRRLLGELDAAGAKRDARFICALVLAQGGAVIRESSGECRGWITKTPRGTNGFGYDPVFLLLELNKTFAELTEVEKNRYSHRARAVASLIRMLESPPRS